jgi:hypothetical protein
MKRTMTNRMMLAAVLVLLAGSQAHAQTDPLPSWNDGAAKKAIVDFVKMTTEKGSAKFVAPEARIAVFDQDGTPPGSSSRCIRRSSTAWSECRRQ